MRPNYHPEGLFRDKKVGKNVEGSKPITQLWHENGRCPEGTIPIRRTKKEDLLRASSIKSYGKKNHRSVPKPKSADPEPDLINQSGHQVLLLSGLVTLKYKKEQKAKGKGTFFYYAESQLSYFSLFSKNCLTDFLRGYFVIFGVV